MELKELVDGLKADWENFKKTNDAALKAKAEGKSVADLEEKLAKLNESIDSKQAEIDQVKTALKRHNGGEVKDGEQNADQTAHRKAFLDYIRKGRDDGLAVLERKALQVGTDTDGGFLVNADLSGRIIKRIFETSPIRQFASVQTISTDALEGPTDTDEADAGWVGEAGARPETTTPNIGMWRIATHEVYAKPKATQKLLDDAVWDVEAWLAGKIGDKISRKENLAFILGNGVTQPRGLLTYPVVADSASLNFTALKQVGKIKTGTADNFPPVPASGSDPAQGDPLINLVYALKTSYREMPGTAFFMHRSTVGRVRRLRDNLGNYLWMPGLAAAPSSVLGYPIAEFNDMPQLGDTSKLAIGFGNLREAYQIVDRVGIRTLRDPFSSKPFIEFYTTKRVGGDLVNFEAIKLLEFAV